MSKVYPSAREAVTEMLNDSAVPGLPLMIAVPTTGGC